MPNDKCQFQVMIQTSAFEDMEHGEPIEILDDAELFGSFKLETIESKIKPFIAKEMRAFLTGLSYKLKDFED